MWLGLPAAVTATLFTSLASCGEYGRTISVGLGDTVSGYRGRGSTDQRVWLRLRDAAEAAGSPISPHNPAVQRFLASLDELERPQIAAIHRWLHANVLTGTYRESLYDVGTTLETGDFNCLTAALLFKVACERSGISVRFVATAEHVSCRASDGTWIEPTCADWFGVGFGEAIGVRSRNESAAFCGIGWQGLLARVCYNRGVARLAAGDFPAAASDFALASRRDPAFREAFENQLAALNNGALACCAERNFPEAIARLQAARTLDPTSRLVQANALHIDHQWSMWLCESGSYGEALALLEAGRDRQPQAALYRYGPPAIARQWLEALSRQQPSLQNSRIRAELTARYPDAAAAAVSGRATWDRSGQDQ